MAQPVKVVILGGGFAGISAAMELARRRYRSPRTEVHLINNENYFVFQPLLPEVLSCSIEPSHILSPIRQMSRDIVFHYGTVTDVNVATQRLTLVATDIKRPRTLPYDHFIWALGLAVDLSRIPGMAQHSFPVKTLGDAFHLRNHILRRLEEADQETDATIQKSALTFVTVGGGFSGVEIAAAINDLIASALKFYPRVRASGYQVVLIHAGERILNELDASLSEFAFQKLRARHIQILLKSLVMEATPNGIVLADGTSLPTGTIVCTVGNAPYPLIAESGLPHAQGRIKVDEYLRVPGVDNVWALGDAALVPDSQRGGFCPPTAQYAMRQGIHCARNLLRHLRKDPLQAFRFKGVGQLAMVGRRCGVARILGWNIEGFLAWFLWRSIYLMKIPGLRSKLRVGLDWALDALFPRDISMIEVQRTTQLARAHYSEGEIVFRQGEAGDRFFIIESGEVEILREEPGQPMRRLGTRSAGSSFGELALLKQIPRTATIRCLTPVNVVAFSRLDFLTISSSYQPIRSLMEQEATALFENDARLSANHGDSLSH